MSETGYDAVTQEEEDLVVLDGAGDPYEWQPTIAATIYANHALQSRPAARADVIQAYIIGYNQGAADERLRSVSSR